MSSAYQSGKGNGVTISWPLRGLSDLDAPVLGPAGQIVCWQNAIGTFFVGHVAPLATLMYLNSTHTTRLLLYHKARRLQVVVLRCLQACCLVSDCEDYYHLTGSSPGMAKNLSACEC